MRNGFYVRLAADGVKKNSKLYIPYLLTGTVMVMMYYISAFLGASEVVEHMKGGGILRTMLPLGKVVIGLFSLIFLFYSNSFLIRHRMKEFGLYNVLGMDKRNLRKLLFWENLILMAISICGGLLCGIALSKLAELGMLNLVNAEIDYVMRLELGEISETAILYIGIYVILFVSSLIRVQSSNPLKLLQSSNIGEKTPKANWLFAIMGIVLLVIAYYIALSIKQPLNAIPYFMVAVVFVIIATYLLFVSGSVAFCKILQKNKNYYYKANHFVSVSSMAYRMKRNGAGLGSICVLITMVLVMLSATLSLYIGAEDSFETRYPHDISLEVPIPSMEYFNEESFSQMRNAVSEKVVKQENVLEFASGGIAGVFTEDGMIVDYQSHVNFNLETYDSIGILFIITLDDYNRIMGTNETLEAKECLLYCYRTEYFGDTFAIQEGTPLKVKAILDEMYLSGYAAMQVVPTITLVTADFSSVVEPLCSLTDVRGDELLHLNWNYNFDMEADANTQISTYECLRREIHDILLKENDGSYSYVLSGKESERAEFFGMYGGLFFVGILLGIVFLFAAVLIIYYKQITEGFEDKKRFNILKKVGMTKLEIRKSINSQVLTVFFLPLILAGMHLAAAFPILWKLLQLFNLSNQKLMLTVTIASYFVFALVYALVYKITSNAYYMIVSGGNEVA